MLKFSTGGDNGAVAGAGAGDVDGGEGDVIGGGAN